MMVWILAHSNGRTWGALRFQSCSVVAGGGCILAEAPAACLLPGTAIWHLHLLGWDKYSPSPEPLQLKPQEWSFMNARGKKAISLNMSKTAHPKQPKETSGRGEFHMKASRRARPDELTWCCNHSRQGMERAEVRCGGQGCLGVGCRRLRASPHGYQEVAEAITQAKRPSKPFPWTRVAPATAYLPAISFAGAPPLTRSRPWIRLLEWAQQCTLLPTMCMWCMYMCVQWRYTCVTCVCMYVHICCTYM